MRRIDFVTLRLFVAIADLRSLTRAAARAWGQGRRARKATSQPPAFDFSEQPSIAKLADSPNYDALAEFRTARKKRRFLDEGRPCAVERLSSTRVEEEPPS